MLISFKLCPPNSLLTHLCLKYETLAPDCIETVSQVGNFFPVKGRTVVHELNQGNAVRVKEKMFIIALPAGGDVMVSLTFSTREWGLIKTPQHLQACPIVTNWRWLVSATPS